MACELSPTMSERKCELMRKSGNPSCAGCKGYMTRTVVLEIPVKLYEDLKKKVGMGNLNEELSQMMKLLAEGKLRRLS